MPKSDSIPLRRSQKWESPYLFCSHQINNNILLCAKILSLPLPLGLYAAQIFFSHPAIIAYFPFHCLDSYLYICCSVCLPVCRCSHTQANGSFLFLLHFLFTLNLNPKSALFCTSSIKKVPDCVKVADKTTITVKNHC